MRDATGIHVQRMIVHMVNHHKPNMPVLSEVALPLGKHAGLGQYMEDQINYVLGSSLTTAAKFSPDGDRTAATACEDSIANPRHFVAASRTLGQRLFDVMAGDQRISPGSLAVCTYCADNYPNEAFLALVKVDPTEAFVEQVLQDEHGHSYVGFDVRGDVWPTAREQLHKAALIRRHRDDAEFDLLILDRQFNETPRAAAAFFAETFLSTIPALDARQRTDKMYRALIASENKLRGDLTPLAREQFRDRIEEVVRADTVDLDQWVNTLALPATAKERVTAELANALPDKRFALERAVADTMLKTRRFLGDFGLRIKIRSDHFRDVVVSQEPIEKDGQRYWRIVLETKRWDEV